MLRMTVEIVPFGNDLLRRIIGTMIIANDGTGDTSVGNYQVRLSTDTETALAVGSVKGHDRGQGAWPLVALALKSALDAEAA
mgnify:CR=1 FL=1